MEKGMTLKKSTSLRDGTSTPLDLDKVHRMVELACEGLAGVSESHIEINSGLQFFDGIKTSDIQEILIRSANDLISLDAPNYQYVAARLLLFSLRKSVYGEHPDDHPHLRAHVDRCVKKGIYDPDIVNQYTLEEWDKLNGYIDHDRDYLFTYAGIRQVADKYLVQDRSSGEIYETPQFMYMMVAATLFQDDDKFYRLEYVKKYYDAISKHRLNIPTPIMGGVRTPIRQFAKLVFWLILMTPSIVSLVAIWLLANMSLKGQVLVSTQVASGASTVKSGVEKFNTQVLSPSLKSLSQLSDAVLKTGSEAGLPLSTFLSGIRKSKTSWFSKTTKEQKTTESEN